MDVCSVVQKEFVRLIQSSGVLVVLSQAWIEELYHQVLERNLLAESGFSGSSEDHTLPLITMLTGTHTPVQFLRAQLVSTHWLKRPLHNKGKILIKR